MKLEDALEASTVGAAGIPTVEDIIYCKDGTTWWFVQDHYIQRPDHPLSDRIRESVDWHPIKPIRQRPF